MLPGFCADGEEAELITCLRPPHRRYMTQACRINGEPHTQFPYTCMLADVMRAKRLLSGTP